MSGGGFCPTYATNRGLLSGGGVVRGAYARGAYVRSPLTYAMFFD